MFLCSKWNKIENFHDKRNEEGVNEAEVLIVNGLIETRIKLIKKNLIKGIQINFLDN